MRTLHIIMPMAGEGSRFLNQGIVTPKPLIKVESIPVFSRAIASLRDIPGERKYSFIVRAEHLRNFAIDRRMREIYPQAEILSVERTTRGATETCLLAASHMADDDAVIILDCDLEFYSESLNRAVARDLSGTGFRGGRLVSFAATHPRYSYAEVDGQNRVIRTAEKVVISNHALAGAYYFSHAADFLRVGRELIRRYESDEFAVKELYLSLLYNLLLAEGLPVTLHDLTHYRSFGTPEELQGVDWTGQL